ncbi:MAG: UvrD-helicase domain-containing protein, partial [Sphaerochaetaceae bacterium]|nr:UvrD-helicase domain-containing protein [Sphaerochaetaceae bacterium]
MTFDQIMNAEEFVLNDEQKKVVDSTINTVVSAGAGAGKTAVLSWRFLKLVMEKGARPDEILTLTFTKKAASEMRERIYKRLLQAKDSLGEGFLESFSQATISTLDSFCLQIVRGDCISYGLPRDISNLSEDDLSSLVERLSFRFLADPANRDVRDAIAALLLPSELMDKFFMLIAQSVSLCGDYDASRVYASFLANAKAMYQSQLDDLVNMLDHFGEMRLTPGLRMQYSRIRKNVEDQCVGEKDYFFLTGIRDEAIKDYVNNGIAKILNKDGGFMTLQNLAKGDAGEVPKLQIAVERFAKMLNAEKRRLGSLSFNDISDLSVSILKNNLKLREVYKKRYKFIMIDEFQDNNSKQRDLLFLLAEKLSLQGISGHVPTVEELEPEKLFFVGDEKQSIYKFRGAEVSVFRALQDEIGKTGNALSLSMNYRSQPKLIDHFNKVFAKVLADGSHDYDARFAPIAAGRKPNGTDTRIIFAAYNKDKALPDGIDDFNMLEAEAIGNYCVDILTTDDYLVDGRRPRPEEIAILFGTASNQMNIEKALKRRNLSYQITETRSLMLDAVASDFYNYINCILYPEDRRSMVALYKSPFCGMCEQSIHNVLFEDKAVVSVDAKRYEAFQELFAELQSSAFRMTLAQLLETLYIQGGYKAYLEHSRDSHSFIEHYEYLYSYALKYDSEGRGMTDFAKFLRDNLGSSEKLPEATVLHRQRSGIQVMTVHKSKGLEFKVVIYCGIGGKTRSDSANYVFKYSGDLIATEQKRILKVLEEDKAQKELAEKRRLMYVALTRAQEHLILIGGFKMVSGCIPSSGDVFMWYKDAVGASFENFTCKDPDVIVEDVGNPGFRTMPGSRDNVIEKVSEAVFESHPDRISVTDLKHYDGTFVPAKALPTYDADAIVVAKGLQDKFGTLCHYVLEVLMRDGSYDSVECNITDSERDNQIL